MSNDVEIKVSADAQNVRVGMQNMSQATRDGCDKIANDMKAMQDKTKASGEAIADQFRKTAEATAAASEKIKSGFQMVGAQASAATGVFDKAKGKIVGSLMAIGAAIGLFKMAEFVGRTAEAAGALHDLSQKTGMSVESLSGLSSVAKLSGTSIDSIAMATNKLSFALASMNGDGKGAAAAVRALGIDFNAFKSMAPDDRLMAVAKAMSEFEDGSNKTAISMALFGRQGAELLPFLADLGEAGKISAKVTTEEADAADRLGDNWVKLRANGDAWKKVLSAGVIPAMSDASSAMVEMFNTTGGLRDQIKTLKDDGTLDQWARNAVTAISYVVDGLQYLMRRFDTVAQFIVVQVLIITTAFSTVANVLNKLAHGEFSQAFDSIKEGFRETANYAKDFASQIEGIWTKDTIGEKFRETFNKKQQQPKKKKLDEFKNVKRDDGGGDSKAMQEFEKRLQWLKAQQEADDQFKAYSKEQERDFWATILATQKLSAEDRRDVELKLMQAQGAINKEKLDGEIRALETLARSEKKNYEEQIKAVEEAGAKKMAAYAKDSEKIKQIEEETAAKVAAIRLKAKEYADKLEMDRIKAKEKGELDDLALQEANANVMLQLGRITLAQKLDLEQKLADEKFRIQTEALDAELAILKKGTIEFQKAMERRRDIEQQYKLKTTQIDGGKQQAKQYNFGQAQQGFENSAMGAGAGALTSMLMKEKTAAQALRELYKSVASTFLSEMITKPLMWMAMRFIRESALYQGMMGKIAAFFGFQKTAEATAATTSVAAKKAEAFGIIPAEAAVAAGGAASAVASIPFVGPAMAAGAYAETMAMVMGGLSVASAAGGFDIPAGTNPMTQLHEKEMVLPSRYADVIRGMAEGGGAAPSPVVNFHVQAMDGASVKRVLMANQGALVESLAKAYRNGHRP
jgi:hypothetical protein